MYSHTKNENGTYNTRCLYCFMTIAAAVESEQALDSAEENHLCPEQVLSGVFLPKKSPESQTPVN